jgi:hypothetical protein
MRAEVSVTKNAPKSSVVAFKVEEELAGFLNNLPNKSEFIRRAIHAQLGIACPLCQGTGKVTSEVHDHFTSFLKKYDLHSCEGCGDEFAVPKDAPEQLPAPIQQVVETIKHGGPEYCYTCVGHTHERDED